MIAALICMAVLSVIMMLIGAFSGGAAVAALVISIIAGFIYANMLKSAMNTIAVKSKAAEYMDDRSVVMGNPDDRFMFSKTEKKEKQKQG